MQYPCVVPIYSFSPGILLKSKWSNHTIVVTQLKPGKIPVRDQISMWSLTCQLQLYMCKLTLPYLPSPPLGQDMTQSQFFKRSLTGFNSEYSFTKAEEPSLSYYLPIAGGRIIGFIPFPRVLVPCEMQSVSSRIWTRVAMSISYDDNHYTTGTSIF